MSADPIDRLPHKPLFDRRFSLAISLYHQVAANEVSIDGFIGPHHITGSSVTGLRRSKVELEMEGDRSTLSFTRRLRPGLVVRGRIMGQPISGMARRHQNEIVLEGVAGQEPIRYQVQSGGGVTNRGGDLGVRVGQQALFAEVTGSVDRVPDALAVICMVPLVLQKQEPDPI